MAEYAPWNDDVKVSMRWHPRITPFRLAFIISTATLGIAKAVLVSKDETISSTTVEWVISVLLALISQLLSPLEPREHHNRFARFVFSQDCLTPLWRTFSRPSYIDDERPVETSPKTSDSADLKKHHLQLDAALVTPYRLLVSTVTAGLGIAKMSCAYTGSDATMDAMDWAFSVPVILSLYYIGLYENNTVGFGRGFFEFDCSHGVIFVIIQTFNILLISGTCFLVPYWIGYWYNAAVETINFPVSMLDKPLGNDPIPLWVHKLHDQSLVVLSAFAMAVCALLSVIPIFAVLLYFAEPILKAAAWVSARARQMASTNDFLGNFASRLGAAGSAVYPYAFPFLTNLVIVSFYALAIFLCLDFGVFALGLGLRLFPSLYLRTDIVVLKVMDVVMGLTFGLASYAPFRGGFVVLKELLERLSRYRRGGGGIL